MNWKQVNVKTSDEMSDIVSSVLLDAGAHGVEIVGGQVPDAGECESGAVANGNDVTVKAYYGEYDFERVKAYIRGRIESLKMLGVPEAKTLAFDVCTVKDADWNENFKKHFKAFRAAGRIVVKPTWEEFKANKDDIVIEIDPGMAFGSGVHETTRMCLELLQKYIKRGDAVLDVGCGSGILAIAAAKLGAGHVLALDYDNVSVRVAMDNAETNGARVVEVRESDLLQRADTGPYNIITANIIADTIIKLNKKAGSALARGGIYIVSGIIGERLNEVADSLKNRGYSIIEKINIGEWFALAAVRDTA